MGIVEEGAKNRKIPGRIDSKIHKKVVGGGVRKSVHWSGRWQAGNATYRE